MSVRSALPLILLSASVACAPAVPKGTDTGVEEGDLLESFVLANHTVFQNLEELATGSGMDLESDLTHDWPQGGQATVTFGSSNVDVDFTVDRTDYTRVSRVWSVALTLDPLKAGGDVTEGELSGTWTYWEEVEGDPSASWVQMTLSGAVNHPGTAGAEATELFAIVNGNGDIWEANVVLGADTYVKEP